MKKKTGNIYNRGVIASILAVVMFCQSMPMELVNVLADEIAESITAEETIEREFYSGNMVDAYNIGNGYIIEENIENRTPNSKEFLISDGTIMVQQFVEPVHYLDGGEYKEINNLLCEEDQGEEKVYKNTANSFKVEFRQGAGSCVEIAEDGYNFTFAYKETSEQSVKPELKDVQNHESKKSNSKEYTEINNGKLRSGKITFSSIETDTDITYTVKNKKVRNEIVIGESKDNYTYTIELESKKLKFAQDIDGSVYAFNAFGQKKFVMPLPYMVDANGNYSNLVTYELGETQGETTLTLTADAEWINKNAQFPISIIPEIKSANNKSLKFSNVYEKGNSITNADKIYVGKKNGKEKSNAFLSFNLPEVEPYYQLIGAAVNFEYKTQGMGLFDGKDLQYNIYVAESTSNLSSVTYENTPEEIQKLNGITRTSQYATKTAIYESDIINTTALDDNTLTIGIETSSETSEDSYITMSAESETTSTFTWYQRVIGLEDDYSLEEFEINGARAYVNNGTNRLTTIIDLASVNTLSDMPFEAQLIYNDCYDKVLAELDKTTIAGNNFKLNFQQFMIPRNGA